VQLRRVQEGARDRGRAQDSARDAGRVYEGARDREGVRGCKRA
jgi:hypothetical protein